MFSPAKPNARIVFTALLATLAVACATALLWPEAAAAQAPPAPSPDAGEVELLSSCLRLNGRIDVHVRNDDAAVNPSRSPVTYEATIGRLAPRSATVAFGERHRFSATGRPDGTITVVVEGRGLQLVNETVPVDCDDNDPAGTPAVTLTTSCLAGNGRFDVKVRNRTASPQTYDIVIGALAPRTRTVAPGAATTITATGRRDGSYDVSAAQRTAVGSTEVFRSNDVPVACDPIASLRPEVRGSLTHDTQAFTQGLQFHEGRLFESTGTPGAGTSIRELDPDTGAVLRIREFDTVFGEGIAVVGDEIWLLTWRTQVGYVLDLDTFETVRTFTYQGEGWGLCFDGTYLAMSNGTDEIVFRDPETFEIERSILVTRAGVAVQRLNELECVAGKIWANVWLTDDIVEINRATGVIESVVDASDFALPRPADGGAVLNGIAWNPADKTWLITGKLWPNLWTVDFVDG